jgi:hypothetical protein
LLQPPDTSSWATEAYVYRVGTDITVVAVQSAYVFFDARYQKIVTIARLH